MEQECPVSEKVDVFGDLATSMEVRVGHCSMTLKELCALQVSAVLLLDKPVGETLDLYVGNVRLASGEVVIMEDRMALRITEFDLRRPGQPAKVNNPAEYANGLR
jgi:flagellar motor switch protein FliN